MERLGDLGHRLRERFLKTGDLNGLNEAFQLLGQPPTKNLKMTNRPFLECRI